jgi:uncharacterized protein with HEPN domain
MNDDGDAALLLDMILAARDALSFLEGLDEAAFMASRLHQNAMIRSLEVIGEAAGKVSSNLRAKNPEIPWREITGMRHRLAHNYRDVQLEIVWFAVIENLAPLIAMLEPLIGYEGKAG